MGYRFLEEEFSNFITSIFIFLVEWSITNFLYEFVIWSKN